VKIKVVLQILLIVISGVIGAVIQVIYARDTPISLTALIMIALVFLCLAAILFINTGLSTAFDKYKEDFLKYKELSTERTKHLVETGDDVRAKVETLEKITGDIDEIRSRVGVKITYVERGTEEGKHMDVYKKVNEIVSSAAECILVVNSYLVEGDLEKSEKENDARDDYYKILIEKAKAGIDYKRILQVKPDDSTLKDLIGDKDHLRHYWEMSDEIKKGNRHITLKRAEARRPTTFVIVDKKHLIWQINEVKFEKTEEKYKEALLLHGIFIIHDPQNEIISHFVDYYDYLDWMSTTKPITDDMLPSLPEPGLT
jgi:hypothetical protein